VIVVANNHALSGCNESEISYHAVVVLDVSDSEVTLYDSATGENHTTYPKKDFVVAWSVIQRLIW
jgi:hypothetical protein